MWKYLNILETPHFNLGLNLMGTQLIDLFRGSNLNMEYKELDEIQDDHSEELSLGHDVDATATTLNAMKLAA